MRCPDLFSSFQILKIIVTSAAVCFAAPALADSFHLVSGKVVEGAIVSQTDDQYVIQTEMGTINIAKSDVVRVQSEGTSQLEVQGDVAAKKGDVVAARTAWTQALANAEEGSRAARRLQDKIARLQSATQQASATELQVLLNQAEVMLQTQRLDGAQAALDKLETRLTDEDDALTSRVRELQAQVHYAKGVAARDAVKMELAQQEWEEAIIFDPSYYPAYIALGNSLLDNSATARRGVMLLEDGLRVGGNQISEAERYATQYQLAEKYYDMRDYARAAAAYASLIPARERYPAYADALDKAVQSYVNMGEENMAGNFHQTIATLNAALRLNPQNEKALFLLGRIYLDVGQIENAVVTLGRLVQSNPKYPEAQLYLGRAYFKAHDYESAVEHLSAALAVNPNSYDALVDRAEAYINMEDYAAARTDLATARAVDPNRWIAYYLQASLAFEQKDYDAAQEALMEALQRNGTAIPAHLLMGRVLDARNQPDAARKWLDQVVTRLQREPQLSYRYKTYLAEALTRLGEIAIAEQSPRQAENYLGNALEVDPNYTPALLASADALLLMTTDPFSPPAADLYEKAERLYLRAIELEPAEPEHYLKLARFYQQYAKNNTKAVDYYNQYVDAGGRNLKVNIWLAEVGGQPRDEITSATIAAAREAPVFPGTAVTTSTVTMADSTTGAPTMTTTTVTGMVAPATGMPVVPQSLTTETSDVLGMSTSGISLTPATPAPMPGTTPAPMPGATPAPMPGTTPAPMPETEPMMMPGATPPPVAGQQQPVAP